MTNALNPKVSTFYLAAFPQFLPMDGGTVEAGFLLVVIHSLLNAIWFAAMVLLLGRLTSLARSGTVQRWIKGVTGLVFVGFGVKLAMLRP
jgi:threonine/homoserine/homoserine lactone efflux protein